MLRPANVTTPFTAFIDAVPLSAPVPVVNVSVTRLVAVVTVLPPASWIVTTGCWANAVAAAVLAEGCVVKTSFAAAPVVIANAGAVIASASPLAFAFNTLSAPARLMLRPANVATPFTAFIEVVPASVPVPVVNVSVTRLVAVVTVLPPASWIVTTGCWANAVAAAVLGEGCVVNTSLDGAPIVIAKAGDVTASVSPVAFAVNTLSAPARFMLRPANVATPFTAFIDAVPPSAPVPVVNVSVTRLVAVVTVLPPASWIVTTGCWANAVAAAVLGEGCVVKTSFAAVPAVTVTMPDAVFVSVPDAASIWAEPTSTPVTVALLLSPAGARLPSAIPSVLFIRAHELAMLATKLSEASRDIE